MEHKTFTETGAFIKAVDFEQIWVAKSENYNYNATDVLSDDEYLDYQLWVDMNIEALYKKYFPNSMLYRGKNPNIIFHGGCLGCLSQRLHGFERCKGCIYFRSDQNKANLHIKGEECATMSGEELVRLLSSRSK